MGWDKEIKKNNKTAMKMGGPPVVAALRNSGLESRRKDTRGLGESWSSLPMLALPPELSVRGLRWRWLAVAGFCPFSLLL